MKVLFVFAHIDDAEIYCGGTMLKFKEKKIDFDVCITNTNSLDKNIRIKELKNSNKICKYNLIDLGLDDGALEINLKSKSELKKLIQNYDLVITMNEKDYHFDHTNLSKTIKELASYKIPVLECDTLNGQNTNNQYIIFNEISNYQDKKFKMISCFKSQNKDYSLISKVVNNFRGVQLTGDPSKFYEVFYPSLYHIAKIKKLTDFLFED